MIKPQTCSKLGGEANEKGRNKNVFAICPDIDDLAYVQKLLGLTLNILQNRM